MFKTESTAKCKSAPASPRASLAGSGTVCDRRGGRRGAPTFLGLKGADGADRGFLTAVSLGILLVALGFVLTGALHLALLVAGATYALAFLAMFIHELGHVMAALALGVRVSAVSFGYGRGGLALRCGETLVLLGPAAQLGWVFVHHVSVRRFRSKSALILLAGPGANLVAFAASLYILGTFADSLSGPATLVLSLWAILNLSLGVMNLCPESAPTAFGTAPNDGMQLLRLRELTDEQIEGIVVDKRRTMRSGGSRGARRTATSVSGG